MQSPVLPRAHDDSSAATSAAAIRSARTAAWSGCTRGSFTLQLRCGQHLSIPSAESCFSSPPGGCGQARATIVADGEAERTNGYNLGEAELAVVRKSIGPSHHIARLVQGVCGKCGVQQGRF